MTLETSEGEDVCIMLETGKSRLEETSGRRDDINRDLNMSNLNTIEDEEAAQMHQIPDDSSSDRNPLDEFAHLDNDIQSIIQDTSKRLLTQVMVPRIKVKDGKSSHRKRGRGSLHNRHKSHMLPKIIEMNNFKMSPKLP